MSRVVILLAALLCTALARADLVVVQKVEGGGLEGEMTIKFKEKNVRADLVTQVSTIVDAETGETVVLQHKNRTFSRITTEQTKKLAEQMLQAQGISAPPKLTATGETKPFLGQPAQAFLWEVGQMKIRFWVAKDFPNAAAIQQQLSLLQNSGLAAVAASMMPSAEQLPGVRLRTEMEIGGQKVNTTILSIKEEPVEAVIFKVPTGYKEVPMPGSASGDASE